VLLGVTVLAVAGAFLLGRHLLAEKRFAAAERALDQRNFAEAQAQLSRCQSLRSDDPDDLLLAVRIARRSRANEETDAQIRTYLQKYSRGAEIEREIRLFRTQQGSPREVDTALTEALGRGDAADPWELEAAVVGGIELMFAAFYRGDTVPGAPAYPFLQKVQGGANLWLQLRPAVPDQVEGLVWRGRMRAYSNDRVGGLGDFRAALVLDPEHRDARLQLALAVQQEAPVEAAGHLEILRKRYPDDGLVRYTLASLYRVTGRPEEARNLLDAILAAEPDSVLALLERGALAVDQGQLDRAEQCLVRAQKRAPEDPRTNFALSICLRAAGRPDEAKTFHDRSVRLVEERRKQFEQLAPPAPGAPR
jgi:tetratricopeptide (TPR) repeat protein